MEAALLSGAEDRYGIYQIADGTRAEEYAFMSMDFVEKNGMKILREDYRLVYSGTMGADDTLDTIYEKFVSKAKREYARKYGIVPEIYDVTIGDGSRKLQ